MNAFKINKSEDTSRKEVKKARWRPSCVREEAESAREGAVNKETIDSAWPSNIPNQRRPNLDEPHLQNTSPSYGLTAKQTPIHKRRELSEGSILMACDVTPSLFTLSHRQVTCTHRAKAIIMMSDPLETRSSNILQYGSFVLFRPTSRCF
jgi:hypothetical protein